MKRTSSVTLRSPFTTCFTGTAQENRERLRNIFDGGNKRPGRWLFFLSILVMLFCCFYLVSCQASEEEQQDDPASSARPEDGAPVFTLTEPGEETIPFSNLLGFHGTVIHTVTEEGIHWYTYQAQLSDGTMLELADASGEIFHLDLDGDGQLELLQYDAVNGGLSVWRRWPDGSVRFQRLDQAAANRFGLEGEPWRLVHLTFHPEDRTVTISAVTGQEETVPLSLLLDEANSGDIILTAPDENEEEGTPLSTTIPFGTYSAFYEKLSLDGQGKQDDSLIVTSFDYDSEQGPLTVVEATLGTGEILTWTCNLTGYPDILPAHLTSPERQSIVLILADRTSNYGVASYFVLEAKDGALNEKARLVTGENASDNLAPDSDLVFGASLHSRPDGLQTLQIPAMYPDKWHTRYGILSWNGMAFVWEQDNRFSYTSWLTLSDGRELTILLSGPVSQVTENDYSYLYYDRVEIFDGDTLIQTITPSFPLPDPYVFDADTRSQTAIPVEHYYPHGFSAETTIHDADIRDVNFDGSDDLGLPCDTTHYDAHAWYLWDPTAQQFRYAFSLEGNLTVDKEQEQLIEQRFDEGTHAYTFNARGQLVWMGQTA